MGIGVPDHTAVGGRRDRARVAFRSCTRERSTEPVDNLGGILSLALVGALILAINFHRSEQGHADPRARGHRGAGASRVLHPSTPRGEPALRPGRCLPACLLGGGLRRSDRVRLADGRGLREPAVPPERPRLLDAGGGRIDFAGRGFHGARRTALGQARRGTRRPLHAAVRLRVPPPGLHHDAGPLEGGQLVLGDRDRLHLRGHRCRICRYARIAFAHGLCAGQSCGDGLGHRRTCSATSAGRSCSRSSGRCLPRATRPPQGR